eukprot:c53436_g1_i1 orf=369-2219(+)
MAIDRDREGGDEVHHREVEEASMPSTSLDHWEAQSVDVHKTAFPVYEDDDDRGLSRTFRISIITGSILMMIAVILCLAVILPHSSKRHGKGLLETISGDGLTDGKTSSRGITVACRATRFPRVCESTLSSNSRALRALRSQDIIEASIEVASNGEAQSYHLVQDLFHRSQGSINITTVARNCEQLLLRASKWFNRCMHSALTTKINDVQTWMSAALTYQNDCHSALSTVNTTQFISDMMQQIQYVNTLTSNALSMVDAYAKYGSDPRRWKPPNRRTLLDLDFHWLRRMNRALLEIPATDLATLTVSKDGGGNFTSIQAAVDSVPVFPNQRTIIYIKEGVYNETVRIPWNKTSITFVGDGMNKTIITGNRNVAMPGISTYESATVGVDGDGFMARNITIENTAGPDKFQAVALRVDSDLSAFYSCAILGYQDTLYVHSLRQFYRNCKIEGTIDFIFGNSASVFQNCKIIVRAGRQKAAFSIVTAQGRTDPAETTALVFQDCIVNGTRSYMEGFYSNPNHYRTYLGRPWKLFSRTIFINTFMEALIRPEGWLPWNGTFALDTLFFGEYKDHGPGANSTGRVLWSSQMSTEEALHFTVVTFIQGTQWLPSTNVPFTSLL